MSSPTSRPPVLSNLVAPETGEPELAVSQESHGSGWGSTSGSRSQLSHNGSKRQSLAPSDTGLSGSSTPASTLSRFRLSFQTLTKVSSSSGATANEFDDLLKSVHKDSRVDLNALESFLSRTDPSVCQTPETLAASTTKRKSKVKLFVSLFRDDVAYQYSGSTSVLIPKSPSGTASTSHIEPTSSINSSSVSPSGSSLPPITPVTPMSATFDGLLSKTGLIGLRTGVMDTSSVAYGTLRANTSTASSPNGTGGPLSPPPFLIPLPESPDTPSDHMVSQQSALVGNQTLGTPAGTGKPGLERQESLTGSCRGSFNGTSIPLAKGTFSNTIGRLTLNTGNPPPPSRADPNRSNSILHVKCGECHAITAGVPAVQFLQMTITAHESNQLELSLHYLRHAQEADPTLALPPFLEGVYLRHGWGCTPDLPKAYQCLHRAFRLALDQFKVQVRVAMAAAANNNSDVALSPRPGVKPPADASKYRGSTTPLPLPPFELSNAKSMVALTLYEISASHRFGWGVIKQRAYAHQIMELAANMGDMDACINVGMHAIKHGNKRRAAKYLRWASFGGWSDFGTGWVFKEKYDDPSDE